mmetsp:Transcript_83444/g.131825  ORF Transcript_83444/g.131825 Transcript_83444/m.131825 type:complete len:205 (-) Transcript_83444:79-693(-)
MCRAAVLSRFKLSPTASQADLRKSYYKMAKLLHPDIAGPNAEEDFKRLREDYEQAKQILKQGSRRPSDTSRGPGENSSGQYQSHTDYGDEWHGPQGQHWKASWANTFRKGQFTQRPVGADAQRFREKQKSHTQSDGAGGYSYTTSNFGFNTSASQHQHLVPTPAQRLRQIVKVSSFICVAMYVFSRLGRNSAARRASAVPAFSN